MFKVVENKPLAPHSTLRVGGHARYFAFCENEPDILAIATFAKEKQVPLRIIGSGSNTIFCDGVLPYCFVMLTTNTIRIVEESKKNIWITADAGVLWDNAVVWAIKNNVSGIEALSGIPGTCGAAPIQNIGAYEQEIKDTLVEVRAYDTKDNTFISIPSSLCAFEYRSSIFKTTHKNRYIIISIVLKLSKLPPIIPEYQDVKKYFEQKKTNNPSPIQIRTAILEIRKNKLPNPTIFPNVGSFFKNPIIHKTQANELQKQHPDLTIFPVSNERSKIPAGWLIEKCGLKGTKIGPVEVYAKNALVLINHNNATFHDVMYAKEKITHIVKEKFDIALEVEPEIITG